MSKFISNSDSLLAITAPAFAQSDLPTHIRPDYVGGYTITHPGTSELPTHVRPDYSGGYIATQPGSAQPPTYIRPDYNGGYAVTQPGGGFKSDDDDDR